MARADDKKAEERARENRRNRLSVLGKLCNDPIGRKFLWNIIVDAHVFAQTVNTEPGGHAVMCFKEGERAMGLSLFNDIVAKFPAAYLAMTQENAAVKIDEDKDDGRNDDTSGE